jgi:hypothetical protein
MRIVDEVSCQSDTKSHVFRILLIGNDWEASVRRGGWT